MSFPTYPRYKNSGIEWLGEVPEHWNIRRARTLGTFTASGIDKKGVEGEVTVKMFNYLDVYNNSGSTLRYSSELMTTTAPGDKAVEHSVRPGDILLTPSSETAEDIGHAARVSDVPAGVVYSYHLLRFRLVEDADPAFMTFFFASLPLRAYFASVCTGTTRMVLVRDDFKNAPFAIPPRVEQVRIAAFLDRETAKIDALVAEQRCLIELLKEKRLAVISDVVIPQGKERTTKLAHIIELTPGFAFPSEGFSEEDNDLRLLRGINVGVGTCRWDDTVYWTRAVDARIQHYYLRIGDVVLGMDRPWIKEGTRVARIGPCDVPSLLVQRVARIRAKGQGSLRYIYLVLASRAFQSYLEAGLTGVSVPHISERQISSFSIRLLPLCEQERLAAETEKTVSGIETLIAEAERAITLLQERRAALISAAVTGKIDVRGFEVSAA